MLGISLLNSYEREAILLRAMEVEVPNLSLLHKLPKSYK